MAGLIVTRLDAVGLLAVGVYVVKELVVEQDLEVEGTVGQQEVDVEGTAGVQEVDAEGTMGQ